MDAKGWVLTAVEKLGWAGEREIVRWLDEAGEELSRLELERALATLLAEGKLEQKGELYRRATPGGAKRAFDALFEE
ncbi:hypothetical protein Ocepr_0445 [Oceanithermus profundus DSM 14977]|uniref:Uncharacterized protein n=1 Tax=Oceanithermus profundus (strain DSM 14977 / NBRC 100410 / VKM B-2274 / 506) TaxID=670487 RepID=E4U6W1_OCEP5|nr:hypothetical protein [Oceanithermus profundus]ADR35905.1 hypothetical protein Ocepr_0445 [Oceanithermus profundus DSM 14977]